MRKILFAYNNSGNVLGFRPASSGENEGAANPTSLKWGTADHNKYIVVNGNIEPLSLAEVNSIDAKLATYARAEVTRVSEIDSVITEIGLRKFTIAEANEWVDKQIDSAKDASEKVEAFRTIIKRMLPYIAR